MRRQGTEGNAILYGTVRYHAAYALWTGMVAIRVSPKLYRKGNKNKMRR